MPIDMQAKFLRVLQDGIVTRLGDTKPVVVDVRIIAATNEDLFKKSQTGEFRSDLYFRLSVVEILLPPLRERGSDIDLLVDSILQRLRTRLDQPRLAISVEAIDRLRAYGWPGNIRELENVLETAAIMSGNGVITPAALPRRVLPTGASMPSLFAKADQDAEREPPAPIKRKRSLTRGPDDLISAISALAVVERG